MLNVWTIRSALLARLAGWLVLGIFAVLVSTPPVSAAQDEIALGLPPTENATYIPELGGLVNATMQNHYGQKADLAECIVLRNSKVENGTVRVPAGGLFYASSTSENARPLAQSPFLLLGEEAYLLRMSTAQVIKRSVKVKKGEKALLDPGGYRLWYEYPTDHYGKPYGEFALIAPSGGWSTEMPLSTSFPEPEKAKQLNLSEGINPQQKEFFMSRSYLHGLTKLTANNITYSEAHFASVEYPTITDAVFSLDRPHVVSIQQESFRWHWNKRIYAYRKENGILVEVRDWSGNTLLASKLLIPSAQQEYHVARQEEMCLTDLNLDLHIELVTNPSWLKGSDLVPWSNGTPYGWEEGTVSFLIYDNLVKVKNGEPWPRDDRYIVRLEPDLMTGMLKRMTLENKEAFALSKEQQSFAGPIKISDVWDRKYFNLVIGDIENEVVKDYYVRDSTFRRTDNLVLWKDGRDNIDLFIGRSELVVSVMEDTFLQRLADPSYGVPVVKSRFTSYPPVIPSAKWFAPDRSCAFVPKMKGFVRKIVRNRSDEKLTLSETLVVRSSYVDYRSGKIIIPPRGLFYSSRNARNIRPLAGESTVILGRQAYLLSTESYLVVKKNFRIDLWKETLMGDGNRLFWQDVPLGDGSKALRYTHSDLIWGRPCPVMRVTKYSGNTWGANMIAAPGFSGYFDMARRPLPPEGRAEQGFEFHLPEIFAEGATYLIPKWISPDFIEVAEMGTPGLDSFTVSYKAPQRIELKSGETKAVGRLVLHVKKVDPSKKTVKLSLVDSGGKEVAVKTLGPLTEDLYDTLPQYGPSQQRVMMQHEDVHIELALPTQFENGVVPLFIATDCKKYERDKPWPGDPRFVLRPDVCGHCYMLNEVILDNPEAIVLDAENNTFVGPENHFKIVVDDFDGESINAWHIEDNEGRKTPNLAELPRNNLDVMVGVNGTTENFLRKTLLDRLSYRERWRLL